ncbi:MAG: SGNH/GDSL hydrolase family protein [Ignavibacteriales bacterium]|nr:SGNH/GDSL hydrolase family protein [Ignavibacteriales bacterium]
MKILHLFLITILSLMFMEQSLLAQNTDWPNFERYREDNIKLGLPRLGENRVVFMGNSITEGWKDVDPDFFKDKPYINRGISGQTTPQMLVRFRADVVNLKPKVVVILAGTNDIAGNTGPATLEMIEDNIASMVEIAKANNINVVLCSVLPAYDYPWKSGLQPAEKIVALNKWIKDYSEKNKIIYADFFTPMADERNGLKKEYSEDGVHPNKDGYDVMTPLVEKAIAESLNH